MNDGVKRAKSVGRSLGCVQTMFCLRNKTASHSIVNSDLMMTNRTNYEGSVKSRCVRLYSYLQNGQRHFINP